jgi:hypothetical protein
MSKPKMTIFAIFPGTARQSECASPNGGMRREGRLENSSGEWIRTTDLRVMSKDPESVPFAWAGHANQLHPP